MFNLTVKLDPNSRQPLYQQIYHVLVGEIRAGRLKKDEKLPSKRDLCRSLDVSLSTVETAYGILLAEGYIYSLPRKGFYASALEILPKAAPPPPSTRPLDRPEEYAFDFSTGAIDVSAFPYASWAKITKETVYQCPHLLQRGEGQGDLTFRSALAAFLREYRYVRCDPEQIVVGAGMELLLDMLPLILPQGTVFAVENPGYPSVWRTLNNRRASVVPIPLDQGGMRLDLLQKSGANVAYVTPSHQFPMGVTMPAAQRTRLLAWAGERPERYVVEDDYDSEFRYATRTIPSMQGLDENERILYIGTFSRSIAPSIRVAYMVLPHKLLSAYRRHFGHASSTVSRIEQESLRRFIERGLYARHLRRMGNLYRKKQELLTRLLIQIPGARISGNEAGLHLLLTLPGRDEHTLTALAQARGIGVNGLSKYYLEGQAQPSTLVLGFAGLSEDQIAQACGILRRCWEPPR